MYAPWFFKRWGGWPRLYVPKGLADREADEGINCGTTTGRC